MFKFMQANLYPSCFQTVNFTLYFTCSTNYNRILLKKKNNNKLGFSINFNF